MSEAVVVGVARTPVGKYGGVFKDVHPVTLAKTVVNAVIDRTGVDPSIIDFSIFGQAYQNGEWPNIARLVVMEANLPDSIPGVTVEARCCSGAYAVASAAGQIINGVSEVALAGGVESMSQAEYYLTGNVVRWGARRGNVNFFDRIARARETSQPEWRYGAIPSMMAWAEEQGKKYDLTRQEIDEWSLRSHQRAVAAMNDGRFAEEIVPVEIPGRKGQTTLVDTDEHPRPDTTLESLAKLKPVLGGLCTAGNSSGENDGAAAVMLMSREKARELGLQPLAKVRTYAMVGANPWDTGDTVDLAVRKALKLAGLTTDDVGLFDINEAFAVQCVADVRLLGLDPEKVNVNGSGISLGHPIGCTGARIAVTLLKEMQRRDVQFAVEALCGGGGMGIAVVYERV